MGVHLPRCLRALHCCCCCCSSSSIRRREQRTGIGGYSIDGRRYRGLQENQRIIVTPALGIRSVSLTFLGGGGGCGGGPRLVFKFASVTLLLLMLWLLPWPAEEALCCCCCCLFFFSVKCCVNSALKSRTPPFVVVLPLVLLLLLLLMLLLLLLDVIDTFDGSVGLPFGGERFNVDWLAPGRRTRVSRRTGTLRRPSLRTSPIDWLQFGHL